MVLKEPPATAGEVSAHVRGTSLESFRPMDCPKRHDAPRDFDEVPFWHDVHQLCALRWPGSGRGISKGFQGGMAEELGKFGHGRMFGHFLASEASWSLGQVGEDS